MRIGLVSMEYPPETGGGGIGTQTYLKAHGLSQRGHTVHVITATDGRRRRVYRDAAVTVHRVVRARPFASYESSTDWLSYSLAVATELDRIDREVAFDILQFPEYGAEGFVYQSDRFAHRHARYVVQLHGPLAMFAEHLDWPDRTSAFYEVGSFMEGVVIRHSDLVLASSHNTAAFAAKHYDYPLEEIRVIHSAVDPTTFTAGRPVEDGRHPRLLFVGTVNVHKGVDLIVDAVLDLRAEYPGISVRIIGKGDRQAADLRHKVAAEHADAHFDFIGYVPREELPAHLAWCDIFVGPSTFEAGPGNVYLEAMACGRPVIACNSGGVPEVVV